MALDVARRKERLAASVADPDGATTAAWMIGIALQWAGEHEEARGRLEEVLHRAQQGSRSRRILRAGFDPHVTARYVLGHGLWIQGFPEQAMTAVRCAVDEARALRHPLTLCSALAFGSCALLLRAGELDAAWESAVEVTDVAEKNAFADHLSYGCAAQAVIALRRSGGEADVAQVRATLACWRASQWHVVLSVVDFAEAIGRAGLAAEILIVLDDALEAAARNKALWLHPELLRVKGELLLQDGRDPAEARRLFDLAFEKARAQAALSWQLRAAASRCRLDRAQGDGDASCALLSEVYAQFREGFGTADLGAARQLLAPRLPA
jgi:hypothetical protein